MLYECTDCKHCANFADGYRVICLHPDLPPDKVCDYYPVGDRDAEDCMGFVEEYVWDNTFSEDDFTAAEKYSEEKYQDVTYEGIREWCLTQLQTGV